MLYFGKDLFTIKKYNNMNGLQFLKRVWRNALEVEEEKKVFFHEDAELIESKHFDCMFRDFRKCGKITYIQREGDKTEIYFKTNDGVTFSVDGDYFVAREIFVQNPYLLPPPICTERKKYVVFDIGMNRGYASLYFANQKECEHVYGFEIMKQTYDYALRQLSLNPALKEKITAYNFGMWDKDTEMELEVYGSDCLTRVKGVAQRHGEMQLCKATVKKASTVLDGILGEISGKGLLNVMKIDVEGSEYTILKDLHENGTIKAFDIILGEYHNGMDGLLPYLGDFYCSYRNDTGGDLGDLGTFVFINKRHSVVPQ